MERECVDYVHLYSLEVEDYPGPDDDDRNVRNNPMDIRTRRPAGDQKTRWEQDSPREHEN